MSVISRIINGLLRPVGYRIGRLSPPSGLNNQPIRPEQKVGRNNVAVPLPPNAEQELRTDHPRLLDLRARYATLDVPMTRHSLWSPDLLAKKLDLAYFRGDNAYRYQIRNASTEAQLKMLVYAQYIRSIDRLGLLEHLEEDGQFGCWTYDLAGFPKLSRDLLDSISELYFLDQHLPGGLFNHSDFKVLDIGAGYGRLAHRMLAAVPGVSLYLCTDAIPDSTFICEYYLRHRNCLDRAKVLPLDELVSIRRELNVDLAVNIHSFSEMTFDSISGWIGLIAEARIPFLMIVPNDPEHLLSRELDGTRRDFAPVLAANGYQLLISVDATTDRNVYDLGDIFERRYLFTRTQQADRLPGAAP